jgi:hypothetical protein
LESSETYKPYGHIMENSNIYVRYALALDAQISIKITIKNDEGNTSGFIYNGWILVEYLMNELKENRIYVDLSFSSRFAFFCHQI